MPLVSEGKMALPEDLVVVAAVVAEPAVVAALVE